MTSIFSTCIVLGTICVDLVSADSEVTVSGPVGSTAVLPCTLPSVDTETPHIIWSTDTETVFERSGEDSDQGEGYEGRVDVPEDELRKGNCSLVLRNLTRNDEDVYTSQQIVKRARRSVKTETNLISLVKLTVTAPEFTVSGPVGSTAVLPCTLPRVDTGTPHIVWSTETETVFERSGEESYQGEGYEGRVDVPEDELRKGNCSLVLHNLTRNDEDVYMSQQTQKRIKRSVKSQTNLISLVKLTVEETQKVSTDDAEMKCPCLPIILLSLLLFTLPVLV